MQKRAIAVASLLAAAMMVSGLTIGAQEKGKEKSKAAATEKSKKEQTTGEKSTSKKKTDSAKAETDAPSKNKAASPSRRLPTGYGQLSLTDEQKDEIFTIRETHAAELADLQKQMDAIRTKMDKEFQAVLSAEQKKLLTEQREAAKAKAAEKSESSKE